MALSIFKEGSAEKILSFNLSILALLSNLCADKSAGSILIPDLLHIVVQEIHFRDKELLYEAPLLVETVLPA